ncbi:MAG: DUF192 domain-containing protein [Planctomycetota bacterium]|nr:DUF192 domain-containing protein [Planctomycetota bacterium]
MNRQTWTWVLLGVLFVGGWVGVTCHTPESGPGKSGGGGKTGGTWPGSMTLELGGQVLHVEVAKSSNERSLGLMHRKSLEQNRGMIFVFPEDDELSFWMKNTFLPLSIAFIRTDGEIVDIQDMEPHDETPVISRGLARYALEVNQGWFAENGVHPGDRVEGLPDVDGDED